VCDGARQSTWYSEPSGDSRFNCTVEQLISWMEVPCEWGQSASGTCCDIPRTDFPYEPSLFESCVKEKSNMTSGYMPYGRVLYDRTSGAIVSWTMFVPTRHFYSETFATADAYWREISAWSTDALAAAPSTMVGGFASLDMSMFFYALQTGTGNSAIESTVVAGIVAGIVILVLTANVLIAVYCTVAIGLLIGAVTGIVVLQGWTLGIIESVIFSTAIGMACDFVAHLGFAYRQANKHREANTRVELVKVAIGRILPPVTAAAFSTALMGFLMLFAATTFNMNFGLFIVLLMSLSWVYAIFCLVPVLSIAGPLGDFLDFSAIFKQTSKSGATAKEQDTTASPWKVSTEEASASP